MDDIQKLSSVILANNYLNSNYQDDFKQSNNK